MFIRGPHPDHLVTLQPLSATQSSPSPSPMSPRLPVSDTLLVGSLIPRGAALSKFPGHVSVGDNIDYTLRKLLYSEVGNSVSMNADPRTLFRRHCERKPQGRGLSAGDEPKYEVSSICRQLVSKRGKARGPEKERSLASTSAGPAPSPSSATYELSGLGQVT